MPRILFSLIFVSSLIGCSSIKGNSEPSLSQQARIWIDQSPALEVLESRASQDSLVVKFRVYAKDSEDYRIFDAQASWSADDLASDITVALRMIEDGEVESTGASQEVLNVSEEHWRGFRYVLAHTITPSEPLSGVALRSHEDELVFFYDEQDHLQVMDLKEKPVAIEVTATLDQSQLMEKIVEAMESYAARHGLAGRRFLFQVDNEDDYTAPFLYVDLEERLAVNLTLSTDDEQRYRQSLINKSLKSADYLLFDSYVLGLARRPLSSSLRLFSWTQGISRDLLKPPALTLFENRSPPPLYEGEGMDLAAFEDKLEKHVGSKAAGGRMYFLLGGDEFFPRLIDAIIAAETSIDIRIFIFDNDDYARSIADLLKRRSKEGIKVRVLLDGMGQVMGEAKLPETLPPGYVPPASMEQYLREDSAIDVRVRPNAWFKADHTKTIIIDSKLFFTGGMNIGREYRYHWHDLMMAVDGQIVREIAREFEIAWAHAGPWGDLGYLRTFLQAHPAPETQDGYPIHSLYTRLNDPQIYKAQLLAIKEAKKYIYIHNPYFSDDAMIYELIRARRRGVDVRVILPFNGNHNIMNASNVVSANTMFRHGIRIYFYPKMSHVKAAIYDGWLCTGSANFDKLSLVDNLELNLATAHPEAVEELRERLFEADFARSMEMKEPLEAGWRERLAEFVAEHL